MLSKDYMGVGPVTAEGNETTRGARLPVSIEHTAYSGYFFLHLLSQKFVKSASD